MSSVTLGDIHVHLDPFVIPPPNLDQWYKTKYMKV